MPQFDVSSFSSQLFWLAVVFSFLYFIVSRFIAPKAESILMARNRCMEENINYAKDYKRQAKILDIEKEEKLAEVNTKVEDMQNQALKTLEIHFNKQKEELSHTLDKKRQAALSEIESYIEKFHTDEPESCVRLAAFIIKKITGKEADLKLLKEIHTRG